MARSIASLFNIGLSSLLNEDSAAPLVRPLFGGPTIFGADRSNSLGYQGNRADAPTRAVHMRSARYPIKHSIGSSD